MYKINCRIEPHYPVKTKFLRLTACKVLETLKVRGKTEATVSIVGDRKMKGLNQEYTGKNTTTNVLSFSQTEQSKVGPHFVPAPNSEFLYLGDIVISYPEAIKDAILQEVLVEDSITKLLTHGILHLLGHDHQTPQEQMSMEKLEDQLYTEIKI